MTPLALCGNVVLEHENESRFCVELFYQLLNRRTSVTVPFSERIKMVTQWYQEENGKESLPYIPVTELFAPKTLDFKHRNCVVFDGVYHTYLYIPSGKYRMRVPAGWISLIINAGEGIDVDIFFFKQDKGKSMERIGRRIRLNRSRLKETYDTNSDFDDLSESIRAGFYLKRGLSGNEELYYMSMLITITGYTEKEVEWRAREMAKLLNSQDIGTAKCTFSEETAFLSSLPILNLDKNLYQKSKRNVLTSGVASCYPFVSYEMSDRDGILMGVNKANNSLVKEKDISETDERNFDYSVKGTYGTAGYMKPEEQKEILNADQNLQDVLGIIFGKDLENGEYVSLPIDSRLNRNLAVCGSQGSMKSRAFARNMALQCVRRGESMYLTDPKSELYEDLAGYLREEGYIVKQLNLIDLVNSDAWDCLAEIDDGSLIDVFVDVVIRNTTDKFDHFYDNVEMDLLKALCLYVYEEYPVGKKTFPEAYKLLLNKSVEMLDAIFERLPTTHPARGPYQLFSKAEKVKGNAVLGLGTRLQIMQNKLVQQITSHADFDLTLPGKQKCAYFCITSDQDSTYDVLATLFTSFLSIKLVRLADRMEDRKLPVPMCFILDEFPNIGVIPDFKKKLATARSRGIGMSIIFQNIPQMMNRYPEGQWEEILGGCDMSLFLGCNDMTTATYYSSRSGEITVSVASMRKSYYTIRMTDYVPEYAETSSVGKRMLLLPDEVLRFPIDQMLLIIRGQKVLKLRKMDYTEHPDAKHLKLEKTNEHIPKWYREMEAEKNQFQILEQEREEVERFERKQAEESREEQESEPLTLQGESPKKSVRKNEKQTTVYKVEDLFQKSTDGGGD